MAVTPTTGSGNLAGLSTPGLGSGLDVNSIVTKLMAVEQQPITLLDKKTASFQAKLSAYGSLKGATASFQAAMQSLSTTSTFQTLSANASDSGVLTASATADATPGSLSLSVDHLAQSQVLAASGIADQTATGSTGSLTIQVGSGAAKSITIDSSNNSLAGIRDAINAAAAGVSATIINSGGATPYKLVLSADNTGADNTINITNNLAAGDLHDALGSLAEVRTAKDAALTVNGVALTSATNTLSGTIPGVTVNLLKAGDSNITVARNTSAITGAVGQFVNAYNSLNSAIAGLTSYNAATKTGGPLLGDSAAQKLQADVRAMVGGTVANGGTLTTLSQVGISFQKDGTLALDNTKLSTAITNNFSDLASLFSVQGRSNNSLLTFKSSTSKTEYGSYQVQVTTASTQAALTATSTIASTTDITSANDSFSMLVNGVASGPLTIAHGTAYTQSQLAQAVQSAINGSTALGTAGISVAVGVSGGKLVITSNSYGSNSGVSGASGNALTDLGLSGSETATGTDVAGSFVINGKSVTASGSGQVLSGPPTSAAQGLVLRYVGTPSQALATPSMTLNLSQGIASRLQQLAATVLDSNGAITARNDGLNTSIKDIATRRDAITRRLSQTEASYRAQFNALDTLISRFNQTSSFLTQQLTTLTSSTK